MALSVLVIVLLVVPPASSRDGQPPSLPRPASLAAGVHASVWAQPSGLPSAKPCDPSLDYDLGCNAFWLNDASWAVYLAQRGTMWPLVRSSLGEAPRATVILYMGAWLADASHGGVPLARFARVIGDITAAGMAVLPFIGRPEYTAAGNSSRDVVHDAAARADLLARVADIARAAVAAGATGAASVYWMGAYCLANGPGFCAPADIAAFSAALRNAVRSGSAGALGYYQHLDGTFWDACWPQPCAQWDYGGYSPASLLAAHPDGLLAESWAMGSLVGGVARLYAEGVVTNATLLLIDDTPNCDLEVTRPCATGSLRGDIAAWETQLAAVNCTGTWGVWDAVDGGQSDANDYGDLTNDGRNLTAKGFLHRARALATRSAAAGGR